MGGIPSAIGPLLMRKVAPFRVRAAEILTSEQNLYKDSLFNSVRGRLSNMSFAQDPTRISPALNTKVQAVREQLTQVTTFKRPEAGIRAAAPGGPSTPKTARSTSRKP